jgi:hypothetical protein
VSGVTAARAVVIVAGRGCAVGSLHLTGAGVARDNDEAARWLSELFLRMVDDWRRQQIDLPSREKQSGDWWNWELKQRTSQILIDEFSPVYLGRCSLPG